MTLQSPSNAWHMGGGTAAKVVGIILMALLTSCTLTISRANDAVTPVIAFIDDQESSGQGNLHYIDLKTTIDGQELFRNTSQAIGACFR